MRSLNPDEAQLWARVTASIRPLSRERPISPRQVEEDHPEPKAVEGPKRLRLSVGLPPPRPGEDWGRNTLDGSWDKRLRGGSVEPDGVLDLHGMNLDGAWRAIDGALEQGIAAGDRVLLLITGHHRAGAPPVERGRIRAAVHDWLVVSRHASRIAAVRGAHRRHGGGGSLYIVLRRSRSS